MKYIGSTFDFNERYHQHNTYLRKNKHANKYLQNAVNKYGLDVFLFTILEIVQYPTVDNLARIEQYWLDYFNLLNAKLYNIRIASKSNRGLHHTEEVKHAQSKRAKQWWIGNEHKASEHAKQLWQDEDIRNRMIEARKKYVSFTLQHVNGDIHTFSDVNTCADFLGSTTREIRKLLSGDIRKHKHWFVLETIRK